MYLLENVFTNEHGEAITVLQLLTKFKMTLSEIDTYLNEYGNRLNSIEFLNVTQQQEINILKSQVATLQTKVNSIQLTLGDYLLRFNDLDVQLSVINGKIDINISDIDTLKTYVNNLGVQVIGINNTLNLLGLTVQGHTTKITNLETSVTSINSDLVDIDNSISLINTQLSNLSVFIVDFESRLAVLETKVNNIGIDIITINNLFNVLDLTVQGHTTQITNLEGDILTINNKNVDQDTNLSNHDARITLLENVSNAGVLNTFICDASPNTAPESVEIPPNTFTDLFTFPTVLGEKGCIKCDFSCNLLRNAVADLSFKLPSEIRPVTIPAGTNTTQVHIEIIFDYKVQTSSIQPRIWYWGIIKITYDEKTLIKHIGSSNAYPHSKMEPLPYTNRVCSFAFSNTLRLVKNFKITKYLYMVE